MAARTNEELFAEGIELFNRGRFFEAHEALEELWKRMRGPERAFIQGIIQTAAALIHLERGNLRGARSLYAKARARLEAVPGDYMSLEVGRLRFDLEICFAGFGAAALEHDERRRGGTAAHALAPRFPRLHRSDAVS